MNNQSYICSFQIETNLHKFNIVANLHKTGDFFMKLTDIIVILRHYIDYSYISKDHHFTKTNILHTCMFHDP